MNRKRRGFGRVLALILILASVLLFSSLGYQFFRGRPEEEVPIVGVIQVTGAITSTEGTGLVTSAINQAISNASVKAVVLRIDSPGGFAHLVEQIYLDVLELKERKPVVASVVTALSGGYYISVAADYIYTHPTSMVGNVGVLGVLPDNLLPSEKTLETGPYKTSGFSRLLFPFNLSHALDNFAGAVEEGRGARLRLSPTELRRGMIYMGSEAVGAGLADEVGSLQKAAEHAATEAGIEEYIVADILSGAETVSPATQRANGTDLPWREITVATLNSLNPPPAFYYLYLPPIAYQSEQESVVTTADDGEAPPPGATGKGQVVVDLSHGNKVSPWVLNLFSAELAMRGVYVGYGETWDEVESALDRSSCLLVAAPTLAYSKDEYKVIDDFIDQGRMLLMFFDPSTEFVGEQALLGPVNSLANRYGLTFGKGYLYNLEDHYGFYRNVYVRRFANNSITRDLETLVLFTATFIHSTDSDAAWTSGDTYASVAERRGSYAPISVITKGNGTVAAFGDITFLTEPYAYVEDNHGLILNIVSEVAGIEVPIVEDDEEPEHNITESDLPVGTVKLFTEWINGEEQDLWWLRTGENETQVERPERITVYHYDGEGNLLRWESDGMKQVYDTPLQGVPFPLVDGKAWAYRASYNLTMEGDVFQGTIEGSGQVVGFEEVETAKGVTYLCAEVLVEERDELARLDDNLTMVSSEHLWISHEAGLVKAESDLSYYVDGQLALEENRSLLLVSIKVVEVETT